MMGETAKNGFQASWQMPSWMPGTARGRNVRKRALSLLAIVLGSSLVFSSFAHAGDDDDEEQDPGIVGNLVKGLSGQGMERSSIEYRERSPLVVPSKIDLPPPTSRKNHPTANWPKDPDEQARQEALAASKQGPVDPLEAARPVMPSELAYRKPKGSTTTSDGKVEAATPYVNQILNPSQLGFKSGMLSGMFGSKQEKTTFKQEPKREALTQPPVGYQTPSPNYNYGTGPSDAKTQDYYNPLSDKGTLQR